MITYKMQQPCSKLYTVFEASILNVLKEFILKLHHLFYASITVQVSVDLHLPSSAIMLQPGSFLI